MKKLFQILLVLLAVSLPVRAVDIITATITVTNTPADGNTVTVNGNVRTWKTTVTTASSQIAIGTWIGGNATNLFSHIATYPYATAIAPSRSGTNAVILRAVGTALSVSASGTWSTITLTTNFGSNAVTVTVPFSADSARTNTASGIVTGLNTYATNSFAAGTLLTTNLVARTTDQTIAGTKVFTGTIAGNLGTLTNGYANSLGLLTPGITNATHISGGLGNLTNGTAYTITITNATVHATGGVLANVRLTSPVVTNASVEGGTIGKTNAAGVGVLSFYQKADGTSARLEFLPSEGGTSEAVIARSATSGQPGLYTSSSASTSLDVSNPDDQAVLMNFYTAARLFHTFNGGITNKTFRGTNTWNADVAFSVYANTGLANGGNAAVNISTNVFVRATGPSAAFSIDGIAGGRDGRLVVIRNASGQNMTINNESGTDPAAANRIQTLAGGNVSCANDSTATFIYDSTSSRWVLIGVNAGVGAGGGGNVNASTISAQVQILKPNGITSNLVSTASTDAARGTLLSNAQYQATSGDTIMVRAGTYAPTTRLGKDGVHWFLLPGTTIVRTDAGTVFGDGASAMKFTISGQGVITNYHASDPTAHTVSFENAASIADIECRVIHNKPGVVNAAGAAVYVQGATVRLVASEYVRSDDYDGAWLNGGTLEVRTPLLWGQDQGAEITSGTLTVEATRVHGVVNAINPGGGTWSVRAHELTAGGNVAAKIDGGTLGVIEANEIDGQVDYNAGTVRIIGAKIAHASVSPVDVATNSLTLENCVLSSGTATYSINAAAAQTVTIAGTISADKTFHANVTFSTGGIFFQGGKILFGAGSPEGAVSSGPALFLRTDGSAATTLYVKPGDSGDDTTGWVAK